MTGWRRTLLATIFGLLPGVAVAQTEPGFEVGPELYYYSYREPNFVSQSGAFGGVDARYTFKRNTWFLTLNGNGDIGYLDYKSSGSGRLDGIWNSKAELRALVGDDLMLSAAGSVYASPYAGVGYRLLYEPGSGRTTSLGFAAYDRLSQYFYLPFGVRFGVPAGGWLLRPSFEYDLFLHGIQNSYISGLATGPGIVAQGDATNQQHSGYGLRGEFLVEPLLFRPRIAFGPFIRWWSVSTSRPTTLAATGGATIIVTEPHNNTLEAGATVHFRF